VLRLKLILILLILHAFARLAHAQTGASHELTTSVSKRSWGWNRGDLTTSWALSLGASRYEDALAKQKTQTTFGLSMKFDYNLTSFLNLKINPRAQSANGHVQSDSATSGKTSSLEVGEASVNLHDGSWIRFSVGALNQSDLFTSMLVDDLAFPAARLSLQVGKESETFGGFFAQAAVPTSSSLTTNSKDYEKTPSFNSAGLQGQWKVQDFTLKSQASYFEYRDLPSGIATDSAPLGNTTIGGDLSPASEFSYEYRGAEAMLGLRYEFARRMAIELSGTAIRNDGAPSDLNQATRLRAALDWITGSVKWTPKVETFRIEPDAVVAYYNSSKYETNRVGYATGLDLQYKRVFKVSFSGGERDVVFESASQSRERFIALSLETLDAVL
jgi:hypothetical protein